MSKDKSDTKSRIEHRRELEDMVLQKRKSLFIKHLGRTGNITISSKLSGLPKQSARDLYKKDEKFADEWDEALETAIDALELECRRRGKDGTEEYVTYQGRVVYMRDEDGNFLRDPITDKRIPLVRRIYSDRLMELMLKAHRPEKYAENIQVDHAVKGGVLFLMPPGPTEGHTTVEEELEKHQEKYRKQISGPVIDAQAVEIKDKVPAK